MIAMMIMVIVLMIIVVIGLEVIIKFTKLTIIR